MKTYILLFIALGTTYQLMGQTPAYYPLVRQADSLYKAKAYPQSATTYTQAFKANNWLGMADDRYNAACSWALAGNADSSFAQLSRVVTRGNYTNYSHITTDTDLTSLHADKRWQPVLDQVRRNKDKAEVNLNRPLAAQLDSIYTSDQGGRLELEGVAKQYGWDSKEMTALWKQISRQDSVNLIAVKKILDQYGWLGSDVVGQKGITTLFLVIQHADQATQEKYLPLMREAVKAGKAAGSSLALLEDRVALGQHKKQLYGSQIGQYQDTKLYYVLPLEDPDNVDKRRASVGLPPLAEYVDHWKIRWDVEQYKRDLEKLPRR